METWYQYQVEGLLDPQHWTNLGTIPPRQGTRPHPIELVKTSSHDYSSLTGSSQNNFFDPRNFFSHNHKLFWSPERAAPICLGFVVHCNQLLFLINHQPRPSIFLVLWAFELSKALTFCGSIFLEVQYLGMKQT